MKGVPPQFVCFENFQMRCMIPWKGLVMAEILKWRNDSMKRPRDGQNPRVKGWFHERAPWYPKFHRVKEKFMKGSVIAEIPLCERKIRERLRDSRNSIVWKKSSWKALWWPQFHCVKEKFVKGSVIAEIPLCERKVHERLRERHGYPWVPTD
jgi:hypothetical protein